MVTMVQYVVCHSVQVGAIVRVSLAVALCFQGCCCSGCHGGVCLACACHAQRRLPAKQGAPSAYRLPIKCEYTFVSPHIEWCKRAGKPTHLHYRVRVGLPSVICCAARAVTPAGLTPNNGLVPGSWNTCQLEPVGERFGTFNFVWFLLLLGICHFNRHLQDTEKAEHAESRHSKHATHNGR
jgi:hypothetical protein